MANLQLFQKIRAVVMPITDTVNHSQQAAYEFSAEHALAQYAMTGCLSDTFYANAEMQLSEVIRLCDAVSHAFIVQTAITARQYAHMKDMPALLVAYLAAKSSAYFGLAFTQVVDNGKMLRTFTQIIRSGVMGRKSLGTRPKKCIQHWLNHASEKELLAAAIGTRPSLADLIKMTHPKPQETWRNAFFAWVLNKPFVATELPPITAAFEAYKHDNRLPVPAVPFQMLTALNLNAEAWASIALQSGWQMVRMNLNTFARHGVFEIAGMCEKIAQKLSDATAIKKAKVFPYQLLTAYQSLDETMPWLIREALQAALEIALQNVPILTGRVVVCPDVSGSMHSSATGYRAGATSITRCIDVAGLIAAAFLRQKQDTVILPFEQSVVALDLNVRDSVMNNATKLASIGGGGTNCSAPIAWLNQNKVRADVVIMVSDNESWMDANRHGATKTMREWTKFKQQNPHAKLICIDIQPYQTTQAAESSDIMNIGGFSDHIFTVIAAFASGQLGAEHWLEIIKGTALNTA